MHPASCSYRHVILASCGLCLVVSQLSAFQEPLSEQEKAVSAIRGWASNIQNNRDGTVRFVRFSRPQVTDEHIAHVAAFPQLDYLAIVSPGPTDIGLACISGLKNLDTLVLSHSRLTDTGMRSLANLPKLERLYLDGTSITDSGTNHLAGLQTLKTLSLADTAVSDATLRVISQLPQLEILLLSGTSISDAGFSELAKLPNLRVLDVSRTGITGTEIQRLKSCSQLTSLYLDTTPVSDTVADILPRNDALKLLSLRHTSVTPAASIQIRAANPELEILLSPRAGQAQSSLDRFLNRPRKHGTAPQSHPPSTPSQTELRTVLQAADLRFQRGESEEVPDFQRHVIPLLGRLGCNGRACHGSFQGQGGFRLSMFGYDFDKDLTALTAGTDPRVNPEDPEHSLILLKPTMQEEHAGGLRFAMTGWEHRLLLRWIEAGARGVPAERPQFIRLDVTPREVVFAEPGETAQIRAVAVWSDGSREDVTPLARFQTNNNSVATVDDSGLITSVGRGDSHVISYYDKGIFSTQVILPVSEQSGDNYPDVPVPTHIDQLVVAKLSKLGVIPAELTSDSEFLRRASLDIAGTLPTPGQLVTFSADISPDKRARKIDELLEHPAHFAWWTNRICDLTGSNPQFLGSTDMNRPAAEQWRAWIQRRLENNTGWDRIVAGILLARSRRPGQTYTEYAAEQSSNMRRSNPRDYSAPGRPMHYYWFRDNLTANTDRALSFGYVFLGVRLDCAQCHKHPFDQWSQQDFAEFTEFFSRVKRGVAPGASQAQGILKTKLGVPGKLNTAALRRQMYMRVAAEGKPIPWNEIYIAPPRDTPHMARLLGGALIDLNDYDDPRELLMEWLVSDNNPYFVRAIVNHIWAHYFHVGIVEPPDNFNTANPPGNKALLDYLSRQFVANGYNLKWLHREITNSQTYQRSWQPNATNLQDERNFSRAILRRLPAETAIDAILQATASDARMKVLNEQTDGRKIAQHPLSIQARGIDYSLLVFGKPLRMTNCDCERQSAPTLLQSLYVRNDHELIGWLERPDGWLQQVARELGETLLPEQNPLPAADQAAVVRVDVDQDTLNSLVEAAYLRTVSRRPDRPEQARGFRQLVEAPNHVEGLRDLVWALINTQEFITNH
ncbi:MAG: DUF1549 domain-containing protein [Planctomycetaceae bacterium]